MRRLLIVILALVILAIGVTSAALMSGLVTVQRVDHIPE